MREKKKSKGTVNSNQDKTQARNARVKKEKKNESVDVTKVKDSKNRKKGR